jgi:RimJ/RimL family protein N-acetyltransferase
MIVAVDPIYRPSVLPAPPELIDGRILLRSWTYCDLPCVEEASRDRAIPVGTTVPRPFSREAGLAFLERQWQRSASGEGLSLAVTEVGTDAAAGLMCLLHRQQPGVVGVGYWTVPSRRRQGLARGGLNLLSRWALGLPAVVRLEALVEPNNEGSIRVLEGAGFRREGLLRAYLDLQTGRADALLYSLIQEDTEHSTP